MARPLIILAVVVVLLSAVSPGKACKRCSRARAFLEASCHSTRYPKLCVDSLMGSINHKELGRYHNPRELAQVALTASLGRARRARIYMAHMALKLKGPRGMEHQAVENCMDQMSTSMDQISQSIRELRRINDNETPDDFSWHSGNVMTWMSAALTDQNSCLDTFPGGPRGRRVQAAVRAQLADVARSTSNALALVNRFVIRHRAGKRMSRP